MTDLHHTLEAAVALAASGLCWLCGAPCAGARCDDAAQCFARQMALPGEPPRPHPAGRGACDPEEGCCDGCAAAYSEADGDDGEEETIQ